MLGFRRKRRIPMRLLAAIVAVAAAGWAAAGAAASASSTSGRENARATAVGSRHTKVGVILVGPRGQTLYLFNRDLNGTSHCYGRCARGWRPLLASDRVVAARGSGVKQRWLSTTRRRHGSLQVTYDGAPLYVNVGHTKPGDLKGDHTSEFGGRWYVVPVGGVRSHCVGRC
jgi:predicted lipoprotein with Yx(FWY)xxD motif